MKKIVLTGGGTAGHVTPNIALLPALKALSYEIEYIGSYQGMEKDLIEAMEIPYHGISSGKLRRYLDIKNLSDPFKVIKGFGQAFRLLGTSGSCRQNAGNPCYYSRVGYYTRPCQ